MMTVLEYANDVDRSIDEIFKICQKMNIKVSKEDDMLSDDDIIILDNELENLHAELKNAELKKEKKEEAKDLTKLTVAELREMAKAKDVKGYSTMKKAELIEALNK